MAAKKATNGAVKVVVVEPYQVCLDGVVFMPGDQVSAPKALADEWRQAGWVT